MKQLLGPLQNFRAKAEMSLSYRTSGVVSRIASLFRATKGRHTKLIAVTGSFGKTTTTRAIAQILGAYTDRVALNCFSYLYFQAIRQTSGRAIGVVEIGIGQPKQMRRYAEAIRPDVAVVTCVGLEHEKSFPDGLDGIRNEKSELVRGLGASGVAVLNRDDERVMWMATRTKARVVTFGRHPEADIAIVGTESRLEGLCVILRIAGREHRVQTRLFGTVSALPISAAVAAAHVVGIDLQHTFDALTRLPPTPRRLEVVRLGAGASIVVDDEKSTPPTIHAAFDAMADLECRRRFLVLGNIPKSTAEPKLPIYHAIARHAGQVFDRILLIHLEDDVYDVYRSNLAQAGLDAARITRVEDVHDAHEILRNELEAGDVVLLKGNFFDKLTRIGLLLQDSDVRCRLRFCMVRGITWCSSCKYVSREVA